MLNGGTWTIYGIGKNDPFLYVPNSVGVLIGLVQLVAIAAFWRNRRAAGSKVAVENAYAIVDAGIEIGQGGESDVEKAED